MTAALWFALTVLLAAPESPGYVAYQRANALFVKQDFTAAQKALDEALGLEPKLVPALTLNAKLAMANNRFDVARRNLETALAVDPQAQYAQFLYGLTAYLANDMPAALSRFRAAHRLKKDEPKATLYLGLALESTGNTSEALEMYREAIRLEEAAGTLQADTLLPGIRLQLVLGRADAAEQWARQTMQLAPEDRDPRFEYARVLLALGKPGEAAAAAEKALTLRGGIATDVQIHYLLIRAWRESGQPDRAALHAATVRAMEAGGK